MGNFNINIAPIKLEYVPAVLAFILVCGVLGIMGMLMHHEIPPANKDAFNIVFGALGGSFGTVVAFYFGSSKSTQTKDATIAAIAATTTGNGIGGEGKDKTTT